ncbi:hypothetical protein Pmar_PMAR004213 [Perkinsus marinus ATCC 50983]|uniref:AB hydrolase-1 domain-containing protein n=1 Tax=Perkinsus marinus (strain ATCC 50983 / TXsc) TaxID=423536 RepID=C5LPM0_PERM5|nr:hypothetical protein Pmar_PMAR004213 [Perkinsus marinus ATCC 50983]EER01340.1 hypothetical protein Pmar_PMAR004213 [Perkinsus marinus ATCC 50983]|eukprot:XP_002768622.1 hypothetical protein Pmar_PMAR004213 [Perkinsus marinus ATCC 50983]
MPWVNRPDGHRIYYRKVDPDREHPRGNIVLIMGLAMPHVWWTPQTAFLSSIGFRLLLIDNRGVGFSSLESFSMDLHLFVSNH